MANEQQDGLDALNQIQSLLEDQEETRGLPSLADLCTQYSKVRPLVQKSLSLVRLIPVYGAQIALALGFLTQVADLACPSAAKPTAD